MFHVPTPSAQTGRYCVLSSGAGRMTGLGLVQLPLFLRARRGGARDWGHSVEKQPEIDMPIPCVMPDGDLHDKSQQNRRP